MDLASSTSERKIQHRLHIQLVELCHRTQVRHKRIKRTAPLQTCWYESKKKKKSHESSIWSHEEELQEDYRQSLCTSLATTKIIPLQMPWEMPINFVGLKTIWYVQLVSCAEFRHRQITQGMPSMLLFTHTFFCPYIHKFTRNALVLLLMLTLQIGMRMRRRSWQMNTKSARLAT